MDKLALFGGRPVRTTYLPYARHWIDRTDMAAVKETLSSDWITTGPKVEEFEEAFRKYIGAGFAVAVSSGTLALDLSLSSLGLKEGDEVITTPMTFCATADAICYQGARPVFVDIVPETLNIDPQEIIKKINSRTRAIIPVDMAGQPCEMLEIMKIAYEHNLAVVEDAAHSLGAGIKNKKVGQLATLTTFSFHAVKNMTTAEGGMVVSDDEFLSARIRRNRFFGLDRSSQDRHGGQASWFYEKVDLGRKANMSDITASLGLSQLKKLDSFLARRRQKASLYEKGLGEVEEIETPQEVKETTHSWHLYIIKLKLNKLKAKRDEIFKALRQENIGVNVHYRPLHLQQYYQARFGYKEGDFPVAEKCFNAILTLPLFAAMTKKDVQDVIKAVKKVCNYYRKR
jgi:dTDP-4-amino-4,6-dideoxygalactose transaminase